MDDTIERVMIGKDAGSGQEQLNEKKLKGKHSENNKKATTKNVSKNVPKDEPKNGSKAKFKGNTK